MSPSVTSIFLARGRIPGHLIPGVLSKFATAFLEDTPPVIFGDGEQTRDFTYVDNAVAGQPARLRSPQCFRAKSSTSGPAVASP